MNLAQLHHQGRIYDPSTSAVATNFGPNLYPGLNNPGAHSNWQNNPAIRVPMSGSDNTALRRALVSVIATGARETITISPDNPWLGRLAPAVRTDELVIKKDFLDIVRGIAPYAPHYGTTRKQRVRQMTRKKSQTRKTWGMTIEKTMLFSEQGNNILQALIRGVRENVAGTLIYEAQQEFLQAGEEYRQENYRFGNNPYQNIYGMQGVAQDNAMLNFYQIRRDMYGALSKRGDQFRAVLDRVIEMLKRRNAQPDALIVGPGIKARLTLGDTENTQYYIAGDAGTFLRVNGSSSIDTFMGLSIIETLPVNANDEIRSSYQREVEVGEYALLTRGENSSGFDFRPFHRSKRIYDEPTDSMKTITLAQVVANAPDFNPDGSLSHHHQVLTDEHNAGSLSYKRIHQLSSAVKIHPSSLSLFIYQDDNNMARVARVWGQIIDGGAQGLERFVQSVLGNSGMTPEQFAEYSADIEQLKALIDGIKAQAVDEDSFNNRGTENELERVNNDATGGLIDARGNQYGSLSRAAANTSLVGYANGAGILTLADEGVAEAADGVAAIRAVIRHARRALNTDELVRGVTPSWFHKPSAVSAFIDIIAGAQVPIWLPVDQATANRRNPTAVTLNFTNVNGANFDAVRGVIDNRTAAAAGVTAAGTAARELSRVQRELLNIVGGEDEAAAAEANDLLLEIARLQRQLEGSLNGLASIDYRSALIFQDRNLADRNGFFGLLAHMLRLGDISPASYIGVSEAGVKKSLDRLVRIAAAVASMGNTEAQAFIAEGVAARNTSDKELNAWYKKTPKLSEARAILDGYNYTTPGLTNNRQSNYVRTGLTVSRAQLQTILSNNDLVGDANRNFKVSHPDAPWTFLSVQDAAAAATAVSANNAFRVGGPGIGAPLQMSEQTFFANLLEPVVDNFAAESALRGKRSRGFDSDDEDDYGYTVYRPSQARNRQDFSLQPSSSSGVRGMDLGESSSSSVSVGARFQGSRSVRQSYGVDQIGAGRQYNEIASSAFEENYDAATSLGSVLEQTVALALLFMPVTRQTAIALAEASDAPFGGFIARPHIRHLMSSAQVVESGPSTALTHYTETDITSVATNTKEWIFNLTWQSTPFVHAPQFTEMFHDACAQGYYGGNDVTFMKPYADRYGPAKVYDPETGAQASIYAFLIGAYDKLPNPTSLTGVHHVSGYDNNQSALPVPHYRGAPLAEKVYGFSQLQAQQVRRGFTDSLANTLVFQGLQHGHTGSQISNDFVVENENTGHWGKVEPNQGLNAVRKGSATLQQ